jgi:DNA-binding IclR family transcriptional regulator
MPSTLAKKNVQSTDDSGSDDVSGRGLRRGLQALDVVLRGGREGLRVIDLCRQCGLERATVYRLLATLIDTGYVAQRGRFRYVAGPRANTLTAPSSEPSDLAGRLQPVLARISAACGDAAFAVLRDGTLSRCIARQIGCYPVQILAVQIDTRQPLGVGAAGLALLAALEVDESVSVTAANATALGGYGGMTQGRLELLVRATRERGWSVVGNHAVRGALGVGMAVHGADDSPLAAISVAASIGRMPRERQQLIAKTMREALSAILPNGL